MLSCVRVRILRSRGIRSNVLVPRGGFSAAQDTGAGIRLRIGLFHEHGSTGLGRPSRFSPHSVRQPRRKACTCYRTGGMVVGGTRVSGRPRLGAGRNLVRRDPRRTLRAGHTMSRRHALVGRAARGQLPLDYLLPERIGRPCPPFLPQPRRTFAFQFADRLAAPDLLRRHPRTFALGAHSRHSHLV